MRGNFEFSCDIIIRHDVQDAKRLLLPWIMTVTSVPDTLETRTAVLASQAGTCDVAGTISITS